ncbi:Zn(II)2Cys6 transcription factor domain-containing protein [Sporobolomyces salmoneus]|uniref:Zn(II)2Cys6 transcription factor domain-containing protein n=1 Tax=Sporobolomyces salmoneus TaxID=183962 RepID=UPI00317D17C0
MSSSPPQAGDSDYVDKEVRPPIPSAPVSLAARFRTLCRTSLSPSPSPEDPSVTRIPSPPPPPPSPVSRLAGYRPLGSRPLVSRPPVKNIVARDRPSRVRSCDQCRFSKQKCDRDLPCGSCNFRKIECTWTQAGAAPSDAPGLPTVPISRFDRLRANLAEIRRLKTQAEALSRVLHLTSAEFEAFEAEARRLVERGQGNEPSQSRSQLGQKRSRDVTEPDYGYSNKIPRRLNEGFAFNRVPPPTSSSHQRPVSQHLPPFVTASISSGPSIQQQYYRALPNRPNFAPNRPSLSRLQTDSPSTAFPAYGHPSNLHLPPLSSSSSSSSSSRGCLPPISGLVYSLPVPQHLSSVARPSPPFTTYRVDPRTHAASRPIAPLPARTRPPPRDSSSIPPSSLYPPVFPPPRPARVNRHERNYPPFVVPLSTQPFTLSIDTSNRPVSIHRRASAPPRVQTLGSSSTFSGSRQGVGRRREEGGSGERQDRGGRDGAAQRR